MVSNEEIQKEFYRLEMYNQQLKQLQEEIKKIEVAKLELNNTIETLEGLKTSDDLIMPIGGGAYIRVKKVDGDKVIVGTGANIYLEKDIGSTIEDFKKSVEDLNKAEEKLSEEMGKIMEVAQKLQKELEEKVRELQESQMMMGEKE